MAVNQVVYEGTSIVNMRKNTAASDTMLDEILAQNKAGEDETGKVVINSEASGIQYDNTNSGLYADDVQEAIDEIQGNIATEEQRAKQAEQNVTSAIASAVSTERTRAIASEGSLSTAISALEHRVETDEVKVDEYKEAADALGNFIEELPLYDSEGNYILDASGEIIMTDATGVNAMMEVVNTVPGKMDQSVYDADGDGIVDNAKKVNGHFVNSDVPEDAKFTDTVYDDTAIQTKLNSLTNFTEEMNEVLKETKETAENAQSVTTLLQSFAGSEAITDNTGEKILDSEDNLILDVTTGAGIFLHVFENIYTWFKENASHIVTDSGYPGSQALYELENA